MPDVDFETCFEDDFTPDNKIAQNLWYFSRQFQDDADIRSKDTEYDRLQRDAVRYWLNKHMQGQDNVD